MNDWGGQPREVDGRGQFFIKGVPPGSYVLYVSQYDQGHQYSAQQALEVGETKIDSIVVVLGGGAKLQGPVVASNGASLDFSRIRIELSAVSVDQRTGSESTNANKDGTFELAGLSDGSYKLIVMGPERSSYLKAPRLGSEDAQQNGVQIERGATGGRLEIVVGSEVAQLEGTVTDSDQKQPAAGATVTAQIDPKSEYNGEKTPRATTDQNGHFVLKDVPPGKYRVNARIPSPERGTPAIKSEPVTVTLGEHEHRTLDLKLTLPKGD